MALHWGIDLGGTKIAGVVVDSERPLVPLAKIELKTEADQGYVHILGRIRLAVERLCQEIGQRPSRIGFGTPGSSDPMTGLQRNSNTQCLNGMPLANDLAAALGVPVKLANDANCFALAEAKWGAGKGHNCVFGAILGTGVGGGVVVGGNVLEGPHNIAGEWGHNVLDPTGPECYCGKRGCVEQWISGPALEAFYAERSGTLRDLKTIAEHATTDPVAQATIERLIARLGQALAVVVNILDPNVIVLGGGVGQVAAIYPNVLAAMQPYVFHPNVTTRIVPPELGPAAGVYGAAALYL